MAQLKFKISTLHQTLEEANEPVASAADLETLDYVRDLTEQLRVLCEQNAQMSVADALRRAIVEIDLLLLSDQ